MHSCFYNFCKNRVFPPVEFLNLVQRSTCHRLATRYRNTTVHIYLYICWSFKFIIGFHEIDRDDLCQIFISLSGRAPEDKVVEEHFLKHTVLRGDALFFCCFFYRVLVLKFSLFMLLQSFFKIQLIVFYQQSLPCTILKYTYFEEEKILRDEKIKSKENPFLLALCVYFLFFRLCFSVLLPVFSLVLHQVLI